MPLEKLRALVERLRNVNKHGVRCDECSNTHWMHQEVEAVANELSTVLAEAEPSERRYTQAELNEAILLTIERTKQNIAEGRFPEAERPTPPVEDAVTRAKLEQVYKDGWQDGVNTVDRYGDQQSTADDDWEDYLRADLKGSPE
jgi:flagellar biosynthesis/type III secretory pathway protein FliH